MKYDRQPLELENKFRHVSRLLNRNPVIYFFLLNRHSVVCEDKRECHFFFKSVEEKKKISTTWTGKKKWVSHNITHSQRLSPVCLFLFFFWVMRKGWVKIEILLFRFGMVIDYVNWWTRCFRLRWENFSSSLRHTEKRDFF